MVYFGFLEKPENSTLFLKDGSIVQDGRRIENHFMWFRYLVQKLSGVCRWDENSIHTVL